MDPIFRQSLFLFVFSFLDIVAETFLVLKIGADFDSSHGLQVGALSSGAFRMADYHFAVSPVDLWIVSIVRCALFLGLAVGVLHSVRLQHLGRANPAWFRKRRSELVVRLRKLRTPSLLGNVALFILLVAKFLFSIEFNSDGTMARNPASGGTAPTAATNESTAGTSMQPPTTTGVHIHVIVRVHPWLWSLLGCCLVSATVQLVQLHRLSNRKHIGFRLPPRSVAGSQHPSGGNALLINEPAEQRCNDDVPLLGNTATGDSDDDEEMLGGTKGESNSDSGSGSSDDSDKDSDDGSGTGSDSDTGSGDGSKRKRKRKKSSDLNKPSTSTTVKKLLKQSFPDWMLVLTGFFFLLVATAAQSLMPLYIGKVINGIAIERDSAEFHRAIVGIVVLSAIGAVCAGLRGGTFVVVCARLNIRLRNRLFGSVVRQDMAFFDTTRIGDITSRLTSDTEKMSDLIGLNINVFFRSVTKALGVMVFMFKLSWKLSLVTLVSLPVVTVISYIYGEYYKKLSEKVQTSLAKANDVAEEVCSSVRTVRSFAWEAEEAENYAAELRRTYRLQTKEAVAYAGYAITTSLLDNLAMVVVLFYGGYLVLHGELSGGYLVSFILYCEELASCIEEVGDVFTGLMSAAGAAAKVFKWIERKPDPLLSAEKRECGDVRGRVEFRNVSFRYPSRPDSHVLKDVSFVAEPGEVVALVGPSGSGKSSCLSLLERFYQPEAGTITLDGRPLESFDHGTVHRHLAIVSQEPVLFARSIRDNIRYALPGCDDGRVEAAAGAANAHDFVLAMPRGYATQAGERGQQLSGGQKQRIAIARSLARHPTVLLLDEATSALDAESEHILQQSLVRAMAERTVIVVAHRLSTVERADRIVVVDDGRVVEQGTHGELLAADGMYARLVQRQLHRTADDADTAGTAAAADTAKPSYDHQSSSHSGRSRRRRGRKHRGSRSSSSGGGDSSGDEGMKRRWAARPGWVLAAATPTSKRAVMFAVIYVAARHLHDEELFAEVRMQPGTYPDWYTPYREERNCRSFGLSPPWSDERDPTRTHDGASVGSR